MLKRFSFVLLALAACGTPTPGTDAGADAGSTGDAGTMMDAGSNSDAGTAATCAAYCTAVQANCTAANVQYTSTDACLGSCAGFTQGAIGATSGNSLECRTYHAGAAAGGPALHCPHAGPAGSSACGMNCEGFCSIAMTACTGANVAFASAADCMTACSGYTNNTAQYVGTSTSGNSFACRMYHLTVAATAGGAQAAVHCPHVKPTSPPCM